MKKKNNLFEKAVAGVAYETAKRRANASCTWFYHQPVLSEKVKKLRKF